MNKKRGLGIFFGSLLFLFTVVSCDLFNPVDPSARHYLDFYSDTAVFGSMKVEEPAGTYSGITCIESNGDKIVTLYIMNPKDYDLIVSQIEGHKKIEFDDSRLDDYVNFVEFAQDANDKSICTLTFKRQFLEQLDNGSFFELDSEGNPTERRQKNISCTITLFDGYKDVEPFHIPLYVNSLPPRIQGGMFQKVDDKYVICFNIPDLHGTVHECDTKDITVGNEHFKIDFSGSNPVVRDLDGNISQKLTASNPGSSLKDFDGSDTVFIALDGCKQFFYYTNIQTGSTNDEIKYKISLSDDYNFTKEVSVSSQMAKLEKPTINISAPVLVGETDGKADLIISHSKNATYKDGEGNIQTKQCASPVIEYEIFKKDGTSLKSGYGVAPVTIPLEKGSYYITAYAQAEGFCDGDKMEGYGTTTSNCLNVKPLTTYYVKAGNSTGNGSKNNPYNSIQKCVNEIRADAQTYGYDTNGYTVNLLSDIKAIESDVFDQYVPVFISFKNIGSENYFKYILNGNGYKIDAVKKGSVINLDNKVDVTINNTVITGGKSNQAGGIWFSGVDSKFKMNGGSITGNYANNYGGAVRAIQNFPVYFNGVRITGNHANESGGGIFAEQSTNPHVTANVILSGNCIITGNTAGEGENKVPSNVYLSDGTVITIVSNETSATDYTPFSGTVGFTTENNPETGHPIQITKNFDKYKASGVSPYAAFVPDKTTGCVLYNEEEGEVYFSSSVSTFDVYNGEKLIVSTGGTEEFTAGGTNGTITVSVQDENSNDITSQCSFGGHMLMYMSSPLNNTQGNSNAYYYSANGNKVTLKNTLTEKGTGYALFIQVTYKGVTYDALLPFVLN